ncbi:MAG: 30S ribosomal protein S7 [Elusimicrobia bacterium]|nr:30S ribosomal protein S7 [Elusimicrobiota bacterium]
MPRKGLRPRERRDLPPADYKYNSVLVSRLINKINYCGKKNASEKVVYGAMDYLRDKIKEEPLAVITRAIENVRPLVEVKPRRVGGATYQVPYEVRPLRSVTLAMRWIVTMAKAKKGKPMSEKLGEELLLAAKKEGAAFKKRDDMHRMAEANRAFAHYRW